MKAERGAVLHCSRYHRKWFQFSSIYYKNVCTCVFIVYFVAMCLLFPSSFSAFIMKVYWTCLNEFFVSIEMIQFCPCVCWFETISQFVCIVPSLCLWNENKFVMDDHIKVFLNLACKNFSKSFWVYAYQGRWSTAFIFLY